MDSELAEHSFMLISRESDGERAIIKVTSSGAKIPAGYTSIFVLSGSGIEINNLMISQSGFFLSSRQFNPETKSLDDKGADWMRKEYASIVGNLFDLPTSDLSHFDNDDIRCGVNILNVITVMDSGNIAYNLETKIHFINSNSRTDSLKVTTEEILLNDIYSPSRQADNINGIPPGAVFKAEKDMDPTLIPAIDEISLVFHIIKEYLKNPNNNIRNLPIDLLLRLQGPNGPIIFTKEVLAGIFRDLGFTNEELEDMHLTQKTFYRTLLEKIQSDIQSNPDSKFTDFAFLMGMSFSLDEFFDKADQYLVQFLDGIMNNVIGYTGYTLLKFDLIRLDGQGSVRFQLHESMDNLETVIRKMGLASIANLEKKDTDTLLQSALLSGHLMKLMTIDSEGHVELKNQVSHPGTKFLSAIIKENYVSNSPNSDYHLSLISNFLDAEMISSRLNSHQSIENAIQTGIINHFYLKQNLDEELIQELSELEVEIDGKLIKVIFDKTSMVFITKGMVRSQDDQGNIIISEETFWLEIGNAQKGLLHLLIQHQKEFKEWEKFTVKQVVEFIYDTITKEEGRLISRRGKEWILYQIEIGGQIKYLGIVHSNFKFIVTAGNFKETDGEKIFFQDRYVI